MKTSPNGLTLIEGFEGLRLEAYQDGAGIWTIGVGHTGMSYGLFRVKEGDTCTQAQAEEWLRQDIECAEGQVNALVTVPLNQNQFDALVSFVFNLGSRAFSSSTLLKSLNSGSYSGAAVQFPRWDNIAGKPSEGLLKRRVVEQNLFTTPDAGPVEA